MYARGAGGGDEGYFRLNIWGMGDARDELYRVGVMVPADYPPDVPLSDYGLDDFPPFSYAGDGRYVWEGEEGEERRPTIGELGFFEASRRVIEGPVPGNDHGIPLFKVGSNDGWLVLPSEVVTGIAYADRHHEGWREGLSEHVREFVEWMETCPNGFEVH
jgi:hypothetical protein